MATSSQPADEGLVNRGHLLTEQANPVSQQLDQLSPLAFVVRSYSLPWPPIMDGLAYL